MAKKSKKKIHQKVTIIRDSSQLSAGLEDFIVPLLQEVESATRLEKFSLLNVEDAKAAQQMLARKLEILREKKLQVNLLKKELELQSVNNKKTTQTH